MSLSVTQGDPASGRHPGGDPEWLAPTQALTRFRLREGAVDPARAPDQRIRYGFRVGALALLVKPRTASEVIGMPPITPIPKGPPWLLGMINLRSDLVPVFDLALICTLERNRSGASRRILVLDKGEDAVALLIDQLPTALPRLSPLQQLPSLPTALRGAVTAGYAAGDDIWLEFDHQSFFGGLAEAAGGKGG